MGAENLNKIQSWVDAAYTVNPEMTSHTGGITSFGLGVLWVNQQSTEAEIIDAGDYLGNTIWIKLFMQAKGLNMNEIVFKQDNESAICMETNGHMYTGQKSRHITIRYFWFWEFTSDIVQLC